jgi:hypothetical protein
LADMLIGQPYRSMNNLLSRPYVSGDPQAAEDAFNVAGAAMTGGLLAPRPRNSLGAGGRVTPAAGMPETPIALGRSPAGAPAPNPLPSGPMADGRPVPVLSRPDHLQGQAPHMTLPDDLLPSASDGWYVHGRARRGDLDTGNVIQGTQLPDVATQYAGKQGGSVWAMRPAPDAKVLDFTSDATADVRRTTAQALMDYRAGSLPFDRDLTGTTGREMSSEIRQALAPDSIVNSAGAFDNPEWVNWLADRTRAGFIRTPDGAVAMSPDDVQAVRLFANGGRPGALAGASINALADNQPTGIRAYHGSPHDFDRFDMSKIGTGEGAQAYGHGLYFAEAENVAKTYKDAGPEASRQYDIINGKLTQLAREMDKYRGGTYGTYTDPKGYELKAEYDRLMEDRKKIGRMYEVNIRANPDDFLDWDKPLSQQPPSVQKLLTEHPRMGPAIKDWANRRDGEGQSVWHAADELTKDPIRAAEALRNAGIPGIRYLDQGSRGAGEGSRNYVVFDDNLIEILRKYGLVGLMAGGAAAGMAPPAPNQLGEALSRPDWTRNLRPGDI